MAVGPLTRYACTMCTFVYAPADNKGVPFADLPADWVCPVCCVPKEEFFPVPE